MLTRAAPGTCLEGWRACSGSRRNSVGLTLASGKLVRDNIPDIIRADGHNPVVKTLEGEELILAVDPADKSERFNTKSTRNIEQAEAFQFIKKAYVANAITAAYPRG